MFVFVYTILLAEVRHHLANSKIPTPLIKAFLYIEGNFSDDFDVMEA